MASVSARKVVLESTRDGHRAAQIAAVVVQDVNQQRAALAASLLQGQDSALQEALDVLDGVRSFAAAPEKILGSIRTKHGEIAEVVEVGFRNASDLVRQQSPTAALVTNRFGSTDYVINGIDIQSKFINGTNNGLRHVLRHMERYPEFSEFGAYHIPKDQSETILRILQHGEADGLSQSTVDAIKANVREIEQRSGRAFVDLVQPSQAKYAEVQQNAVERTINTKEEEVRQESARREAGIRQKNRPTLQEGAKAVGGAMGIAAGMTFISSLYSQYRAGKNVFRGELTAQDWKDIGLETGQGSLRAGVSSAAVYSLSNFAKVTAPLAGAYVSAAAGIFTLTQSMNAGEISGAQFVDLAPLVCTEAAVLMLASTIGQAVIPIPVLGMILGSIAGQICMRFLPDQQSALAIQARLAQDYELACARITAAQKAVVDTIIAEYDRLGDLTDAALDFRRNKYLLLLASIELAEAHRTPEDFIIRNTSELDAFLLD